MNQLVDLNIDFVLLFAVSSFLLKVTISEKILKSEDSKNTFSSSKIKKSGDPPIEVNIIGMLMATKENVSRSALNLRALGYARQVDSHSLDSHIYRLRKKLTLVSKTNEILAKPKGYYQIT